MAKPKLSSKTPDQVEGNSFIDTHDDLLQRPDNRRFAIVEVAVVDRTYPTHNDAFARLQIVRIEEVHGDAVDAAQKLADHAYTDRTGNQYIPTPDTPLDLDELDDSVD